MAALPPLYPEWLGDRIFTAKHGARFPYVVGEMARGLTTVRMVVEAVRAGCLAFYGSAGQSLAVVEQSILQIQSALDDHPHAWGCNLIHSPQEPQMEEQFVDLFLRYNVMRLSASAFMQLTPDVVRFAAKGMQRDASGAVRRARYLFPKISRPEVAKQFMSPPPEAMLRALQQAGQLTAEECDCAAQLPVAESITVEADSGGHTDNRTLTSLFPAVAALRDALAVEHGYAAPIHLGAAGGIGSPGAVAAAFALGAAYVMTGSINQSAVESGLSEAGRAMLAKADVADMAMAPASDMFEMGGQVQVLKRGALFPQRARQLYSLYQRYEGLDAIPAAERESLEKNLFRAPLEEIWGQTRDYFLTRNPQIAKSGEESPKVRMALVFRWYLSMSSRWAIEGIADRQADYQIWCGPVMGTFNRWVSGSVLEPLENRTVSQIAWNLLEGAAVISRAQQLRSMGVQVPDAAFNYRPRILQV
ncbi:putative PfaD family protein [Magnetofaba australis IT-1]|uniref:Putative PfaD family protein n=1 Tax=Magnetofaba australis IT-1 TaxID=1434232 RepID=A0A1Y2K9B2_9PROT|nr:putative PfaD family protein [Magnetofaba australis IT-1]